MDKNRLCIDVLLALSLLLSFFSSAPAGGIQTNIEYGKAGDAKLLLDACVPEGDGPFPMAVIVHGGGWSDGDRQHDITVLFKPLTEAKFTWFSIDYRLAPKYRWPACFEDVRTAVRWVRAHAADFKGDPNRIAIIGYSAGGQLAFMAAVLADDQNGVRAVVGFAPPTDLVLDTLRRQELSPSLKGLFGLEQIDAEALKLLWDASPINYLRPNLPPFLLVHGTADTSVPYQQSLNFRARCKSLGVQCDMVTVEGAPHRISAWDGYDSSYKQKMVDWLNETIGDKKQSTAESSIAKPAVITVSTDGTGDFTTVQAAVDAVPQRNTKPVMIRIRPGTYKERIVIPPDKRFIHFAGDDAETTVLTFDLNARMPGENGKEIGTFRTSSVTIEADDFSADNITFENSAGPVGQALAITVIGDRVVFRNCRFLGWQDTLLDQTGRHYYENCYIAGHVDFIFGGGTAYFEKCHIHCLRKGYITAAATPEHQPYGYVFSNCTITGAPDVKTYLGRPWRDYASTIFLNTEMSEVVRPEGWHNWDKPHREKTARYAEYNSTGPGADARTRVPWARQLTEAQAKAITVESVLGGKDGWNPITGEVQSELKVAPASTADVESLKKKVADDTQDGSIYLFTSFRGNGADGLYLVCSRDGLVWQELGTALLKPQVGTGKLLQDPSVLQGPDGKFHLVWATGARGDQGFGYADSEDLINWSEQKFVELMSEQQAFDVVSPELFYDDAEKRFIITWASTLPNNYYQAFQDDVQDNPRLRYTTTSDFETFAPAKPFFEPGYSVRDAVLVKYGERYALVHNDNRRMMNTLRVAFADTPLGPWGSSSDSFTPRFCRNPAVLKLSDQSIIYFEMSGSGKYGAVATRHFNTFVDVTDFVSVPRGHYGNVLKVPAAVLDRLRERPGHTLSEPIESIDAPFAMPQLQRPVFPKQVFDIRDYGAVGDGQTKNTEAFARTIEACAAAGGGRVFVPAGKWHTGPIHLKSDIDLHLAEGAEIVFSDRFADYLPVVLVRVGGIELYNYSPLIYAHDCENIAVTGPGKLNGNAEKWWAWAGRETNKFFEIAAASVPVEQRIFGKEEDAIRPSFVSFVNCRNVLLEGFTIGGGPNWTIHPVYCENVIIRRLNVITSGPNNDGIDPDSCKNVLIEHCIFDTGDDCVVLKSGYNEDGWRVGKPTESVVMRYCSSKRGHGGLVIGSEMSGDVRNVYMHDCEFEGTDRAVRIKSRRGRGGVVENVWARNLTVRNMQREVIILNMVYGSDTRQAASEKPPVFRNIFIRDVIGDGAPTAILIKALEDSPVENVRFQDIKIKSTKGVICSNVRNVIFEDVRVTPAQGPVYSITNGSDITIENGLAPEGTEVFLKVDGKLSKNIRIVESDLSNAAAPVVTGSDVPEAAVTLEKQ